MVHYELSDGSELTFGDVRCVFTLLTPDEVFLWSENCKLESGLYLSWDRRVAYFFWTNVLHFYLNLLGNHELCSKIILNDTPCDTTRSSSNTCYNTWKRKNLKYWIVFNNTHIVHDFRIMIKLVHLPSLNLAKVNQTKEAFRGRQVHHC